MTKVEEVGMNLENNRMVVLIITDKCPARCRHCVSRSSPERNERMSINDAFKYIKAATRIENVRGIGITGGEPILYLIDRQSTGIYNKYKI